MWSTDQIDLQLWIIVISGWYQTYHVDQTSGWYQRDNKHHVIKYHTLQNYVPFNN